MDQKYFTVTVEVEIVTDGKVKKSTEKYLVLGYNATDVEKKVAEKFNGDTRNWSIKNFADQKIIEVIN